MSGRLKAGVLGAFVASSLLVSLPAIAADPILPTVPAPAVGVPAGLAPKAFIVVDQATGRVISASNELGAFESGVAARLLGVVPSVVFGACATFATVAYVWRRSGPLFSVRL